MKSLVKVAKNLIAKKATAPLVGAALLTPAVVDAVRSKKAPKAQNIEMPQPVLHRPPIDSQWMYDAREEYRNRSGESHSLYGLRVQVKDVWITNAIAAWDPLSNHVIVYREGSSGQLVVHASAECDCDWGGLEAGSATHYACDVLKASAVEIEE